MIYIYTVMSNSDEYQNYFWFMSDPHQISRFKRFSIVIYFLSAASIFVMFDKVYRVSEYAVYSIVLLFDVLIFPDIILFLKGSHRLRLEPK